MSSMLVDSSPKNIIGNFEVIPASKDLKCWSKNDVSDKNTFKYFRQSCYLKSGAFIKKGVYSGTYEFRYVALQNIKRNKLQLSSAIGHYLNGNNKLYNIFSRTTEDKDLTKYSCEEEILVNKNGIAFKVSYCLNSYVNYAGKYRAYFKGATINHRGKSGLIFKLFVDGFSQQGIIKFIRHHIDQIRKVSKG